MDGDSKNRTTEGEGKMNGLEEAFTAGIMLSVLTWGTLKVVWPKN